MIKAEGMNQLRMHCMPMPVIIRDTLLLPAVKFEIATFLADRPRILRQECCTNVGNVTLKVKQTGLSRKSSDMRVVCQTLNHI